MSKKPIKTDEEIKAAEALQFNPKKLVGVGCGVWKYTDDPEKVTRETFLQPRAEDFGIRKNDVVLVSLDGVVKIIGV